MKKHKIPPVKMLKPFTRWSYSAWCAFKACRYAFGKGYYEGIRSPGNRWTDRGNAVHKLSEEWLKGNIRGTPPALRKLEDVYKELKKLKSRLVVEEFWGMDHRWRDANKRNTVLVMKMDAAVLPTKRDPVLTMFDLKTGREYDAHFDQGELYAVIGIRRLPDVRHVDVEFGYSDSGNVSSWKFKPAYLEKARQKWDTRGKQIMGCRTFIPEPSEKACKYCHLRTDKPNGVCDAWKSL